MFQLSGGRFLGLSCSHGCAGSGLGAPDLGSSFLKNTNTNNDINT